MRDRDREVPAPKHWSVNGRVYPVTEMTPLAVQELQNFIRSRVPDPRRAAAEAVRDLPPDLAKYVYDDMVRNAPPWPPSISSPEGNRAIMSRDGIALTIYHACRKHNTGFTRERAYELADEIDLEDLKVLVELIGSRPAEDGRDLSEEGNGQIPFAAVPRSPG